MRFVVKWEVEHYDADVKQYCDVPEYEEAVNNLDDIFKYLDHGKANDFFDPEMQVEYHEGDFNIEYVLIADEDFKEIWRDEDYKGDGEVFIRRW